MVTVLGLLAGCVRLVDGTATAVLSRYPPPADGSGYGGPIDQPLPVPPSGCEWIDDALPALAPLKLKYANGTGSGCQFGAGDTSHEIIQVHLSGPYSEIGAGTATLEPVEVAGVPGRVYVFDNVDDPTFCSVALDVRAYSAFTVDAFDHADFAPSAPDNRANCELATKAAEILVRRYVPLAGGTPFADTVQRPDDAVLRTLAPCEFVKNPIYSPVIEDNPRSGTADFGTTCTYEDSNGALRELVADGADGLAEFPRQRPGGLTTDRTFGDYPAREEQDAEGCVIAIETDSGQVLAVDYASNGSADDTCQVAGVVLAAAIADQIGL